MPNKAALILLVDDDIDFLTIHKHLLEAHGYRVVCSQDTDDAIRHMSNEVPALVITDVIMTSLDAGFQFTKKLNGDARFADVPVIIVTSASSETGFDFQPKSPDDLAAMHADAFLAKPVKSDALLKEVDRLLPGHNKG